MKNLFIVCLLLLCSSAHAKNYYLAKTGSNSNDGLTPATAWQTIAKLNASFTTILPGDSILFRCGDTFYGSLVVGKSGTSALPIVISCYGTGAKPVISGFITLSAWTLVSPGIYQADAPAVKYSVNMVTVNGVPQRVGRYPNPDSGNGGFLTYTAYSGNTTLTAAGLSGTNWAGAQVVARKEGYLIETDSITAQSGATISYKALPSINPRSNGIPSAYNTSAAGYGLFIQRDARTLDQPGEWYFNNTTKKMQMYFSGTGPGAAVVRVSSVDTLINIGTKHYIQISNIAFEGANIAAIYFADAGNLVINNNDINFSGAKGIFGWNSSDVIVDGNTVQNSMCGAIEVMGRHASSCTVSNNVVKNTGCFPGMGSFFDDADYKAIYVSVDSIALIRKNRVDTTGFVAIQYQGSRITIDSNFVNYFDFVKDDGGGIYTFDGGGVLPYKTNRIIRNNIILNGIGAPYGNNNPVHAEAIYSDGGARGEEIAGNSCAFIVNRGIYLNDPKDINVHNNTIYAANGWGVNKHDNDSLYNFRMSGNIFYSTAPAQDFGSYTNTGLNSTNVPVAPTVQLALQALGTVDSNTYNVPNATGFDYMYKMTAGGAWTFGQSLSLEGWKSFSGKDSHSKVSPVKPAAYGINSLLSANLAPNGGFNTNIDSVIVWSPSSNITASWDNTGKITGAGSLKIAPAASSTDFTFIYGVIGPVSSSKKYILRFTTLGTAANGVAGAYIRKSAAPQTLLTPLQSTAFGNTKMVHEFLFTAPTTENAASFLIQIQQSSGITYIDDIEFYEADATVLDPASQVRFEYNATSAAKTVTLDAKYLAPDSAIYNGTVTLQPFTSVILIKAGPIDILPLRASATAPAISCFGNNTTVTVSGSNGVVPYAGTGQFTVNAGKGSLKISVPNPVANAVTFIYSAVGAISNAKTYILRFSTVGTVTNGNLKVYLRQTATPFGNLTPIQTRSFGMGRVDHQIMFTAPSATSAASFLISLDQSSGTTYFDNIAFFEATADSILVSDNLYKSGQFENDISGITTWSSANNHIATLDLTSKISNTYYFPVKDASGAIATATALINQPVAPLSATAIAGPLTAVNKTTTINVTATGGSGPYTGTATINNVNAGHYYFTVTDARGCSAVADVIVADYSGAKIKNTDSLVTAKSQAADIATISAPLKINVFPNPSSTDFSLVVTDGSAAMINITVSSVDGRVLYQTNGSTNKRYSFGNDFIPGMYIVDVMQGNTIQVLKAIKAK